MNIEITEKKAENNGSKNKQDTKEGVKQNISDNINNTDHTNNIDEITKEVGTNTKINSIIRFREPPKKKSCCDSKFFYNFCMIVNLMIISATLSILTYYLYTLTNKIENINFNEIIQGLGSVNENLNNINLLGGKITPLVNQFQNSEIGDLSVKKINYLTDQLSQANFQDFNIDRFYQLIDVLNQTLYNFNNVIIQFQTPFFSPEFNPAFNPTFNPAFNSGFNSGFNPAFNPGFNPALNEIETDEISAQATETVEAAQTVETSEFAEAAETSPVSETAETAQSANAQSTSTLNIPTPSTGSSSGITPFGN